MAAHLPYSTVPGFRTGTSSLNVPKRIMQQAGWNEGDLVHFRVEGDVIVIDRVTKAAAPPKGDA